MASIHDSIIQSYQTDFESSKIEMTIKTADEEKGKILFEGFFAFFFENQLPNSIILDIVEEDVEAFIANNNELLAKSKDYSWPMDYEYIEELVNHIQKHSYKYYNIQASYGLNGWILAKSMLIE